MQEQLKLQEIPVKVYRTDERLMVVAPMPGLEPENIMIEVTEGSSDQTQPAQLTLERMTPTHGKRKGNAGHPPTSVE